jgi:hypothetical protein
MRPFLFATAVATLAHVMVAVYIPTLRAPMEEVLAPIAAALHFLGLRIARPGFDGPLGSQFYIDQIALANWGVVLCTATTVLQALRGNLPRGVPLEQVISARNITGATAWLVRHGSLHIYLVFLVFCGWSFLDATFGWFVFRPKDWGALEIFTMVFVYMTGSLLVPSCLRIGAIVATNLRTLFNSLDFKKGSN